MTRLPDRFIEDRALRDAARAVLTDDIARLRATLNEQGVAGRVSSSVGSTISERVRRGAGDLLDQAKMQAGDHIGVLAVLVGAILLWFARGPIIDWFATISDDDTDPQEPGTDAADPAATDGDSP